MLSNKDKIKITTLNGYSEDWNRVPGLTSIDCEKLNEICTGSCMEYGKGINGIKRYLSLIGKQNGLSYRLDWIEYNTKEGRESYRVTASKA